ncbi:hypothetical protein Plhal703r1_c01g0004211 [Plasmopara halstedii]
MHNYLTFAENHSCVENVKCGKSCSWCIRNDTENEECQTSAKTVKLWLLALISLSSMLTEILIFFRPGRQNDGECYSVPKASHLPCSEYFSSRRVCIN